MRLSRHNMFMEIARIVAQRGTCPRLCVGAVIVQCGKNPVDIGYNGAPSGKPHCTDVGCLIDPNNGISCIRADHAEANAILKAENKLGDLRGLDISLYVTHSPCKNCAIKIVESGIVQVYFETPYRSNKGLVYLMDNKVKVFRVMPNGYVFDGANGDLVEAN